MKWYYYILCFPLLTITMLSCEEVVQKELDKEKVVIVAPTDELQTTLLSHTFLWESVEKAEGYILQMASPSFTNLQDLVINEDLKETLYEFTLSPGDYEWRVKAYNNISETPFTTYTLSIDSTLNLGGAQVILADPIDNYTTNTASLTLVWNQIEIADEYRLEIRSPDWENGSAVINPFSTTSTSYTNEFTEGDYAWSVSAENAFSKSGFSTPRKFTIDLTAPLAPTLNNPANNASISDSTFTFRWTRATDTGTDITDSLYIYTDAGQVNQVRAISSESTSYQDSLGIGTFYWRVKSIDAAGNKSPSSTLWSVKIN